jgi:hypothetical protein
MIGDIAKKVYDDPETMHLLAVDVKEGIIKAAIATVNVKAALARKEAIKNIKGDFTIKNNFTTAQVQFTPMPEGRYALSAIHSTIGITEKAAYMARQEEGGAHTPSRGKTLAIPTDIARGGTIRSPVISPMRVPKIGKRRRVRGKPREFKQKLRNGKTMTRKPKTYSSDKAFKVARAWVAFSRGLLVPIGDTNGQRNLFAVTRFMKTRDRAAFKLEQVYKFDRGSTITKAEPWLLPASEKVAAQCQAIFNAQMKKLGK